MRNKYDYFEFKKLYEEHEGNVSRLAMILSVARGTIYLWIDKMKEDEVFIERACKETPQTHTSSYAPLVKEIKEAYIAMCESSKDDKETFSRLQATLRMLHEASQSGYYWHEEPIKTEDILYVDESNYNDKPLPYILRGVIKQYMIRGKAMNISIERDYDNIVKMKDKVFQVLDLILEKVK